jgi:hypothetical protein
MSIRSHASREGFADSMRSAVINYDRVLVLQEGCIVENDSPAALINREGSVFGRLCMADGPVEFQQLLAMTRLRG